MKIDIQNMISLAVLIVVLSFWLSSISDGLENVSDNLERLTDSVRYAQCGTLGLSFSEYED